MKATCSRSLAATVVVAALSVLLLASTTLGAETVSILGVTWTQTPRAALVVSASGPLAYSEARPAPGVVVLEFPEAVPAGEIPQVAEAGVGLIRAALVAGEAGVRPTSLRIETDPDVVVKVTALPAGLEIMVSRGGTPDAIGKELIDLLAVADATGVSVHLSGKGALDAKAFTLPDPPRLVIDLRGVVNRVPKREHPVGAGGVRRVRVAQFATAPEPVVRVVVDLDSALPFRVEPTAHGALVRVGDEPAAVVAAVETPRPSEPAVETNAQPAPVTVAAVPTSETAAVPTEAVATATAVPATAEPGAVPVSPVTIVEAPGPEATAVPAAEQKPVEPVATPAQPPLTAPPATPPAESPWTTTPAALAEQAAPPSTVTIGAREVESQEHRFTGEPISLELKDADVKDVLRTFAKITGLNVVVDPDVTGSVTVQLENVPWDQCLDIILRINRLDAAVENNVLRVAKLERLTQEKQNIAQFKKEEEAAKPMRTVTKKTSYAKAATVAGLLRSQNFILSDRGSVIVDDRTNQLIIRDSSDRIDGILNLIDSLDEANPQVIIEARIVETTRNFSRKLGLSWGFSGVNDAAHGNTTGLRFPYSGTAEGGVGAGGYAPKTGLGQEVPGGVIGLTFADILDAFNLDFTLAAAESNGLAKIVSSPKVTTQNNEKASIQSGVQLPIQTVANNTVTVQYIDATLQLNVTPQITAEGTVMLDITIQKREPLAGVAVTGGTNVPLSTRDAKTKVLVRDGGTTVIGGIYTLTDNDARDSVPGLGKIPILGALFRSKSVSNKHDELLIFITPRIVKY
jgi:type IV pilus assembly protein PilQ